MALLHIGWTQHPPEVFTGGAVTVGNFDGVHRAHHQLVAVTREEARATGGPAVVVTFDPPPLALLNPGQAKQPLTTSHDRIALLQAAGAEHVVVLNTEPALLALSPEAFFEDVLIGLFRAKVIVEGYNFRFGRNRVGDTAALRALCVESNRRDPNHKCLAENLERLRGFRTPAGRKFEIIELPMPEPFGFREQRVPASYANFLIINDAVLVPQFRQKRRDAAACALIGDCFKRREVVPIDCYHLIWGLGTLHCISQQQPI